MCVNDTTTVANHDCLLLMTNSLYSRQQFADMFVDCFCVTHSTPTWRLFVNRRLPFLVCHVKAAQNSPSCQEFMKIIVH